MCPKCQDKGAYWQRIHLFAVERIICGCKPNHIHNLLICDCKIESFKEK